MESSQCKHPGDGFYIVRRVSRYSKEDGYIIILGCPHCGKELQMTGYKDQRIIRTVCVECNEPIMIYRNMVQATIHRQRGETLSPDSVNVVRKGLISDS